MFWIFGPVCRGQGGTLLSQRSILKGVVVLCHVYRSFLVWKPMSIFISEQPSRGVNFSLPKQLLFFCNGGPITFLERKSDQLITLVLKGQNRTEGLKNGSIDSRKVKTFLLWRTCEDDAYSKDTKFLCEKHKKKTDPKIIFFCIYLHKDRCAKNSSLLSWWQPTTQLKMPKTQKSSARSGPTLHHIGVQTRGISDRVRSTGIPNGWVSTEN